MIVYKILMIEIRGMVGGGGTLRHTKIYDTSSTLAGGATEMIKKPMMALLVLLFALAAVGAGYARWSDTLQVQLDAETGS